LNTIVLESQIPVPIGMLFDFFLNPDNLVFVLPRYAKLISVRKPQLATASARYTVRMFVLGAPVAWEYSFESSDRPAGLPPLRASLVLRAHKCPFPYWRHRWEFEERDGGTRLRTLIEYDVQCGIFSRPVASFVRRFASMMLRHIYKKTGAVFYSQPG